MILPNLSLVTPLGALNPVYSSNNVPEFVYFLTKFNEVTQLPIHECLTYLSYKKDETVLIEAQYKMASQK